MAKVHFYSRRSGLALLLAVAAAIAFPHSMSGQTSATPAQSDAAATPQELANLEAQIERMGGALKAARAAGDAKAEAAALSQFGDLFYQNTEYARSVEAYNMALKVARTAKDEAGQASALENIGNAYTAMGEKKKALEASTQALELYRTSDDPRGQATALKSIATTYFDLGEKQKALEFCNQALPILRQLGDRSEEAWMLDYMGNVYDDLWDRRKALEYYIQALALRREIRDRDGEGIALSNIGRDYDNLWDTQKALDYDSQAIAIFRQVHDDASEASTLTNMGVVYEKLGERQKALECYNQALPIDRQLGKPGDEAVDLTDIANADSHLGEKQKALENYAQALTIFRQLGQPFREAAALHNIGSTYNDLGDQQKALEYFNQSLPICREAGDRVGEAMVLNSIGDAYYTLGDMQKALEYYNQSLPIAREAGDLSDAALTLNNIGSVDNELGQRQQALEIYEQALAISRQGGDRGGEAVSLNNLGTVYASLGERQKALDSYTQALSIDAELGNAIEEADDLYKLMLAQKARQPSLAIYYGKQAVNMLQQVRGNIQGLDKGLQGKFLASKADYYHGLADVLIAQQRLPEAEQVLDLLKQQEYSDYVRGAAADTLSPLTLTPAEKQAEEDYQKSTAELVSLGEHWEELNKIDPRNTDQEQQFQKLTDTIKQADKGLSDYYGRLYTLFGENAEAKNKVEDIKGKVSQLENQIAKSPRTVALYTMVTSDHYRVIVITASGTVARDYAIAEADLNRKVAEFDQALRDPASDPRPKAQELYNILIGPVKHDLDLANADTLVWSLDGVLRYVPMAALYDGKQYLVENLSTVTITPASYDVLSETPNVIGLSVAAMGISRQYEEKLPALPAVAAELDGVVHDAQVQGANGVLPGTILLDGQFTEKAMEKVLNKHNGVVHIASHFVYQPGDDSQSYLLLAGEDNPSSSYHLTVADFRANRSMLLRYTDLLTLSACETGVSGTASNGREVDGLGMTAQLKGAKAVISSLWSVNDASTGQLMSDFYKRWAEGKGKVAKVEALRQAQLDLLLGNVKPPQGIGVRGFGAAAPAQNAHAGYTHPYYWAPFVLMGNWR